MMPSDGHTCYMALFAISKERESASVSEREREACAAISYNACSGWEDTQDTIPFLVF